MKRCLPLWVLSFLLIFCGAGLMAWGAAVSTVDLPKGGFRVVGPVSFEIHGGYDPDRGVDDAIELVAEPAVFRVHPPALPRVILAADQTTVAITDSGEPVVIPASPILPPATSEQVGITLANLALHYPWIALLISVMGSARLWCKPLSQLVHWAIRQTKTTADDEFVAEVERSRAWVWFWWAVDYIASIKRDPPGTVVTVTKGSSGTAALFLVGALGISAMTVGCAGFAPSGEALTPARVQQITRTAVFGTATVWTIKKPDSVPAFEAALRGIDALVAEERWDTAALAASLTSTGVHTFTGDEARLIIAGTTLAMETLGGSGVDLSKVEYARAVILGAQAGLRLALTGGAAPSAS